jgi:hypothetical protein
LNKQFRWRSGRGGDFSQHRRTVIKHGALALSTLAVAPWLRMRDAQAQTASTFDYYISTTGNDSNAGTLSAPWAVTSLQRSNKNQSLMAGKRIGMLPGVYGVYSLWQGAGWNDPALNVPGGTASTPTYIGSSNASGVYQQGTVQITASPSGTPGGGLPGSSGSSVAIMGQSYAVAKGNVTFDGLIISDSNGFGMYLDGGNHSPAPGGSGAFTIQNCVVYNISGSEGNNPGGILLNNSVGSVLQNCVIHDVQIPGDGSHNCAAWGAWNSVGNLLQYNTIYNCNCCIYDKSTFGNPGPSANHTYQYNYLECNGSNPQAVVCNSGGGPCANDGYVRTVRNNIMVSGVSTIFMGVSDYETPNAWVCEEGLNFYNNTVYALGGVQDGLVWQAAGNAYSPAPSVKHYNNIWIIPNSPSYLGIGFGSATGAVTLSDYNLITCGGSSSCFSLGTNSTYGTRYSLASWQSLGHDAHSITTSPLFVAAGKLLSAGLTSAVASAGYALLAGSAGLGAGRIGGVSTGAVTNMGAWDGVATQIGSSIGSGTTSNPVPDAPTLTVS